jgi:hypothetical protein
VVIAETTRGNPRDAPVNLVLKAINQVALVTEQTARMAGRLQGQAKMSATVDALIVAEAVLGGPAVVLTGDVDDLAKLVVDYDPVRIYAVSDV